MKQIPLSKMATLVDTLFEDPSKFFIQWDEYEANVIAALQMVSIASYATADVNGVHADLWRNTTRRMRNWKMFVELAARISLTSLASPAVFQHCRERFMRSISSIEVSAYFSLSFPLNGFFF